MPITDHLEPDVYMNQQLVKLYETVPNDFLTLLKNDLTFRGESQHSTLEDTIGIDFTTPKAQNVTRNEEIKGWCWINNDKQDHENMIDSALAASSLPVNPSLDDYLNMGESLLNALDLPHIRFSTDEVRAYLILSKQQQQVFNVDLRDLLIGQLAEQAMRQLLIDGNKHFKGRAFLFHNLYWEGQDEKDITVYQDEQTPLELGVRCQREFDSCYLYSTKRLEKQQDKIGDYIAFFNHFGHHIYYLTGIVKKEFMLQGRPDWGKMTKFRFPEMNDNYVLGDYADIVSSKPEAEKVKELNDRLRLRYSLPQFLDMII